MLRQDNSVRRMDLQLRMEFMGLETEIYKVSEYGYSIFCQNMAVPFSQICETFENEIRQMGTRVVLEDKRPSSYMARLEAISMDNPVDSFRASVITELELREFIRGMFPETNIVKVITEPGMEFKVTVEVSEDTDEDTCRNIRETLLIRDIGTDDITVNKTNKVFSDEVQNKSIVQDWAIRNLVLDKSVAYASYESEYWFENAEKIYSGEIVREQTPFYRKGQNCCYMNCTVFDGINIRKALLLYDILYLELPIEERLDRFLQLQDMTKNELIELASMGKVIVVITNAECRYDMEMLNAIYRENPMGVLGRRAVNTLLAAYFSQMKERYLQCYPGIEEEAGQLYQHGIKNDKPAVVSFAKHLVWPVYAKANSFLYLNNHSVMSLANYGVNKSIEDQLALSGVEKWQEKLPFEFQVNSHAIHLAMALNATYFPFRQKNAKSGSYYTDYHVADIMEKYLTFFWYGHRKADEISKSRIQQADEQIKFFEAEKELSVLRIAQNADRCNTPLLFGDLIKRLADLSREERNRKIREYNELLAEASEVHVRTSLLEWFVTGLDFVPKGDGISLLLSLTNLLKKRIDDSALVLERQEKTDFMKRAGQAAKSLYPSKTYEKEDWEDIYLLDRIHRVARLKTD